MWKKNYSWTVSVNKLSFRVILTYEQSRLTVDVYYDLCILLKVGPFNNIHDKPSKTCQNKLINAWFFPHSVQHWRIVLKCFIFMLHKNIQLYIMVMVNKQL